MGEQRDTGETPDRGSAHPAAHPDQGTERPFRHGALPSGAEPLARDHLEGLLAGAVREVKVDGAAEARAVAAFREARDAGAHRARTRRRDDWRPREKRRTARSLKATLSVFLASLTLGGVAVAAIGAVDGRDKGGESGAHRAPSAVASTPDRTGSDSSGSASAAPAPAGRPDTAQDTEAHCRAYEKVAGNGKALDSTAWQRLIAAAGGAANVAAYCARQEDGAAATDAPGNSGKNAAKGAGKEKAAKQ